MLANHMAHFWHLAFTTVLEGVELLKFLGTNSSFLIEQEYCGTLKTFAACRDPSLSQSLDPSHNIAQGAFLGVTGASPRPPARPPDLSRWRALLGRPRRYRSTRLLLLWLPEPYTTNPGARGRAAAIPDQEEARDANGRQAPCGRHPSNQ